MTRCTACGMERGRNSECDNCLQYLVEEGAKQIDEEAARDGLRQAERWLLHIPMLAPSRIVKLLRLLVRIIRDYLSGNYRVIPFATLASLAMASLYVVSPFDLIPDFIPGVGFLDDLAVLRLVLLAVSRDLRDYCKAKNLDPEEYEL